MRTARFLTWPGFVGAALLLSTSAATAEDISGLITTTRTIREDSRLVGDVTCTVTGAPCIQFGSGHLELRLNGFTMTGQADPTTGCNGTRTANEHGISSNNQADIVVRGPGIVQRFRATGIFYAATLLGRITGVTATTNCQSGIQVNPTSSQITLEANVAIRNGSSDPGLACGGI